jgi:hypothetical protein
MEDSIDSKTKDEKEQALAELLAAVRNTDINDGYRVFNVTKNKRVMPAFPGMTCHRVILTKPLFPFRKKRDR